MARLRYTRETRASLILTDAHSFFSFQRKNQPPVRLDRPGSGLNPPAPAFFETRANTIRIRGAGRGYSSTSCFQRGVTNPRAEALLCATLTATKSPDKQTEGGRPPLRRLTLRQHADVSEARWERNDVEQRRQQMLKATCLFGSFEASVSPRLNRGAASPDTCQSCSLAMIHTDQSTQKKLAGSLTTIKRDRFKNSS